MSSYGEHGDPRGCAQDNRAVTILPSGADCVFDRGQLRAVFGIMQVMTIPLPFTPEIQAALNYERYHHSVPLVQRRMEVLWLQSHGLAHALIARLAGVSENTRRDYFALYADGVLDQLKAVNLYRPVSDLAAHTTTLEAHFRDHPPATIKEAQHEIETLTGIQRSETQVRTFLKKTPFAVPQSRHDSGQGRSGATGRLSQS